MELKKNMNIIAVDFDNTLAMGNTRIKDLLPNVELIQRLRSCDCYIKIVTARGAKNKLTKKQKRERYYNPIKEWLHKYGVPHNELSFNKEYAHLYIDDMTISEVSDFTTIQSQFTKNNIILTERTCVKECETARSEFDWYKKAASMGILTPVVRFANDELIITEKIQNARKPDPCEIIHLLKKFSGLEPINDAGFETYKDNIKNFDAPALTEHSATFYHGDLSTQNVLVSDGVYCIDPNYKQVFGSYIIDAGKAAFSFYAYENNLEAAQKIWSAFPESATYTITEGMRVCKYKDYYTEVQTLRAHLNI